ncbi:hypothetical protein KC929_01920 [Patescibacteria group bacterium]|nr:hypothetical protein [Patescibacteria group bacterium]
MDEERLKQLERQRDDHVTKIFWAGLQIAGLFAVPLGIAVLIGLKLGGNAVWIALPIAFVFSWVLVVGYFNKISKKMKAIDARIAELKQELGIVANSMREEE